MKNAVSGVTRISDAIVNDIEARILEGSLKPGERLPAERVLAVQMGVSRPSLREALQTLVSKGLLSTRHGGGTIVTERLETPFVDVWQDMLRGHDYVHDDFLEFRHMLEGHAAYLAAQRATEADIARIGTRYAALEAAYQEDDIQMCIEMDVAFHQSIAEASHNVLIGHLCSSLHKVVQGHVSTNLEHLRARPHQWNKLQAQHKAIWNGIRNYQEDDASIAARAHIEFVRKSMNETNKERSRYESALRRLDVAA